MIELYIMLFGGLAVIGVFAYLIARRQSRQSK